ncbi:hypothetical protein D3C75_983620 [compost metagenome]
MDSPRDHNFPPLHRSRRKRRRLRQSRRPVVHAGIGHLHPGELTDIGLEFKNRLKLPLADFRLVRCVRRIKLRTGDQMLDHYRHLVVIEPRPQEGGIPLKISIASGQLLQMLHQCRLAQRPGHRQCPGIFHRVGNIGKQLRHRLRADDLQHLLFILLRHRQVPMLHSCFLLSPVQNRFKLFIPPLP